MKTDLTTDALKMMLAMVRNGQMITVPFNDDLVTLAFEELLRVREAAPKPAVLFCEHCGELHVDKLEEDGTDWSKRPHRTHLCHFCKKTWRPFDFPTYGVPLPAKLTEDMISLSRSVEEVVKERDDYQRRMELAQEGEAERDAALNRTQEELEAQKEMHAATSAQLAEAIMERSTVLDARIVVEMLKTVEVIKLQSLDKVTVDGLLTLVKLTGSGGRINGVTKPEGWPFILCAAVGSPGNAPAVELLQGFAEKLQALGAPVISKAERHAPSYQELLQALEPFRKVAEVFSLFCPPLSVRNQHAGRPMPVYSVEHPGSNEHEQRYAQITSRDFENLHVVLTGKVPEGW